MHMADQHDHPSKPIRTAPPPFVGPPRGGALAPKVRSDRPTLPPFSPPFVKRPSPVVHAVRDEQGRAGDTAPNTAPPTEPAATSPPSWLDTTPNESTSAAPVGEPGIGWVNPDEPAVPAPPQAATGIEWLDSPATEGPSPAATSQTSVEDVDDVFGWDPAEERGGALDTAPAGETLEALKELEPWALPGAAPAGSTSDEVADALERVAARIRSGELFVSGTSTAATDEAALASVLAALLQRARG
jgi:hypothetical protein